MTPAARPFARYGTEKMVYDVRMSPQALWHEDTIFIVYHWGYQLSNDGGYTWTRPDVPLVDFDQNPRINLDTWACTYHSARPSADRNWLHIGFNYMDERTANRHHLYYARLELATGELYGPDGDRLQRPLTRAGAEACKLWDTGHRYSLNPAILPADGPTAAGEGSAAFVVPVSESTPHDVVYHFVRRCRGVWERHPIVRTNDIWSGSHVTRDADRAIVAYLTVGTVGGAGLRYGGGEIERWLSRDDGETWQRDARLVPEDGLLYNNPKPVERADGSEAARCLTLFGWQGPGGLEQPQRPFRPLGSSGRAYLWLDGEWR